MSEDWKKCPGCKLDKWLTDFTQSGYCTECTRLRGKAWAAKQRRQNPEAVNEYHREYRREHKHPTTSRGRLLSDL